MTTHNPGHAILLGGKVGVLNSEGKLITGSIREVLNENLLSEIYQTDVKNSSYG